MVHPKFKSTNCPNKRMYKKDYFSPRYKYSNFTYHVTKCLYICFYLMLFDIFCAAAKIKIACDKQPCQLNLEMMRGERQKRRRERQRTYRTNRKDRKRDGRE